MAVRFKGAHFPKDGILPCGRWYVPSPLSTRHVEARMAERGVSLYHSPLNRWGSKSSPPLEEAFHCRKRPVWVRWRLDATSSTVQGEWRYFYRAGAKHGQTTDFLLTEPRDETAAQRFLPKAIRRHGVPETLTIDGREANATALRPSNKAPGTAIIIRQGTYRNNLIAPDPRAGKRGPQPLRGCKSFDAAQGTRASVERMHLLTKGQLKILLQPF